MNLNLVRLLDKHPRQDGGGTATTTKTEATDKATEKEAGKTAEGTGKTEVEKAPSKPVELSAEKAHQYYVAVLGRAADNTGFKYWAGVKAKDSGGKDLEARVSDDIALSSFLQSFEAASKDSFLSAIKSASANSFARAVGNDRNIKTFVESILKNMGVSIEGKKEGKKIKDNENVAKYVKSIKDTISVSKEVKKENLNDARNDVYNKLTKVVKAIIDDNVTGETFINRVKVSENTVDYMNGAGVAMPHVRQADGKMLLIDVLTGITAKVDSNQLSITQAQVDIINAVSSNVALLKSSLDVSEFLKKRTGKQSVTGSEGDDSVTLPVRFNTTETDGKAWISSIDGGGGKDTLNVNFRFGKEDVAGVKNFETIKLSSDASAHANLNYLSAGNGSATYEIVGKSKVTVVDGASTNLLYSAGSGGSDLELTSTAKAASTVKLVVSGQAGTIKATDTKAGSDPKEADIQGLDISGRDDSTIINKIEYSNGVITFSGDKVVSVKAIEGVTAVSAAGMTGLLSLELDVKNGSAIANGSVVSGAGNDILDITHRATVNLDEPGLLIFSGEGADTIRLHIANSASKVIANGGAGNDTIVVDVVSNAADSVKSAVLKDVIISGGDGSDTFVVGSNIKDREIKDGSIASGGYNFAIDDYQKGEQIQLDYSVRDTYDISKAKSYKDGNDTYLTIKAHGKESGLIVKLTGYSDDIPTSSLGYYGTYSAAS